jgi:L-proline 4-hydroxylase
MQPATIGRGVPGTDVSLTDEQLEAFGRDGVIVLPDRFARDEVDAINGALADLMVEETPENIREKSSGAVRTAMGLHLRHELFRRLVNDPRLLVPAQQVLGGVPIYAQQVKVNVKDAFIGEQWQWHHDFGTHHNEDGVPEPLALNLHIFLDEVTEFNGPLMFVLGSHRNGPVAAALDTETTSYDLWTVGPEEVGRLAERGGLFCPKGAPGTMLMFGDSLVHASPSNMSPWPRRIFSLIVNPISNQQRHRRRADHFHHRDLTPLGSTNAP